jgi:ubiquinone/menaquinone biosynthesis C-methylase UbiE
MNPTEEKPHVCPWWIGYLLLNPLRRILQDPDRILVPYVREGMTVLEIGPGMGFFTLPLARLAGKSGKVICVDVQERMLTKLRKRAEKAGAADRITTILAEGNSLRIEKYEEEIDFALAFAVIHEVPDQGRLFEQVYRSLKDGALLLVSEPRGHVTQEDFRSTTEVARAKGFMEVSSPDIRKSHSVLLKKSLSRPFDLS